MTESTISPDYKTEAENLMARAKSDADGLGASGFSIVNPLELIYKFIFDPQADFMEINKQWSLTYLNESDLNEILELAKNIRIYDQHKFYVSRQIQKLDRFEEVEMEVDGQIVTQLQPIYAVELVYESRMFEMIAKDLGRIQAICAAAGGRKGALIRTFRTTGIQKHDSVEDKTAPKSNWFGHKEK